MYQRWSTECIAPARRVEFWRDAVCDAFLAMTPHLIGSAHDFVAQLEHRALDGGLSLNTVTAPGHGVERTASDLGRGGAAVYFVNVNLQGASRLRQFGREVTVPAGGLLLIDSSAPYLLEQSGPIQLASLAVPATALQRVSTDISKWVARPVAQTAAASLLAAQVQALARWPHAIEPQEAGVIADVLQGLLPAVFGEPAADTAAGRYLVRRVRALIAERYAESSLSPCDVAGIAGVSVRSLHAALAREGTSFAAELTAHRLVRARAMLHSPLCRDSVKAVALRCGYVSPAHFTRSFRARFGVTPGACRPH